MYNGEKIKLPSWGGYWYWDDEKKTVIMHTKEGKEMDIRETERVIYTLSNILDDGWILADEENCPELGGEATFGFDEAIKYLKRGMKLARKGWNGKGIFIHNTFLIKFGQELDIALEYIRGRNIGQLIVDNCQFGSIIIIDIKVRKQEIRFYNVCSGERNLIVGIAVRFRWHPVL